MHKKPDKSDLASKIGAIEDIWGKVFELSLSDLSDIDWVSKNQISFKPFEVENFFIYQDFYKGKIPNDKIPLKVQASCLRYRFTPNNSRGIKSYIIFE